MLARREQGGARWCSVRGLARAAAETAPEEPCRKSILCPRSSADVEHESEAESAACTPPDFVGEEVTFDVRYTGYALAQPLSIDRR
jgi:hypothetical protein